MGSFSEFYLHGFLLVQVGLLQVYSLKIIDYPSPNFDNRLIGPPDMLFLAETETSCDWLIGNLSSIQQPISFHYAICRNGSIFRLVSEDKRAWYADRTYYWHGRSNLDNRAIGITIEKLAPIQKIKSLIQDVRSRHVIPDVRIISDYDAMSTAPPLSSYLPWRELSSYGIGIWPKLPKLSKMKTPINGTETLRESGHMLKEIGYLIQSQDRVHSKSFNRSLAAFQLRFTPDDRTCDGQLDQGSYVAIKLVRNLYRQQFNLYWRCMEKNKVSASACIP